MPGIARFRWLRKVTAPALLQPLEDPKVGVGKDDGERVVRTSALQISRDIDAAFPIEKTGRIGHFVSGHLSRTVIGDE